MLIMENRDEVPVARARKEILTNQIMKNLNSKS